MMLDILTAASLRFRVHRPFSNSFNLFSFSSNLFLPETYFSSNFEMQPKTGTYRLYRLIGVALIGYFFDDLFFLKTRF